MRPSDRHSPVTLSEPPSPTSDAHPAAAPALASSTVSTPLVLNLSSNWFQNHNCSAAHGPACWLLERTFVSTKYSDEPTYFLAKTRQSFNAEPNTHRQNTALGVLHTSCWKQHNWHFIWSQRTSGGGGEGGYLDILFISMKAPTSKSRWLMGENAWWTIKKQNLSVCLLFFENRVLINNFISGQI